MLLCGLHLPDWFRMLIEQDQLDEMRRQQLARKAKVQKVIDSEAIERTQALHSARLSRLAELERNGN